MSGTGKSGTGRPAILAKHMGNAGAKTALPLYSKLAISTLIHHWMWPHQKAHRECALEKVMAEGLTQHTVGTTPSIARLDLSRKMNLELLFLLPTSFFILLIQ